MAAAAGTGTPGANQNGAAALPIGSPGEVVTAAGPLTNNAPNPQVDIAVGTNIVTKAYDLAAWPSLRPELIFDQFAQVRSTNESHRGSSVQFTFIDDIPEQTTPLLENIDVDSVSMDSSTLVVPMTEYGTAVTTTALIRGTGMIPLDPIAAERVGYNAGASVDALARAALNLATTTVGDGTTTYLTAYMLRTAVMTLRNKNVRPYAGGYYVAVISPTQAQHLLSDSAFRQTLDQNGGTGGGSSLYMGEIGTYEGCRIIVNNHLSGAGSGYVIGAEALAKGYSKAPGFGAFPQVVVSPVVDKLRRFASIGWYWLGGYKVFRDDAIVKLSTPTTAVAEA